MRIIIFGSSGMLGSYISLYLRDNGYEVTEIKREKFDVMKDSFTKLDQLIQNEIIGKDTVVINCIGTIPHACKDYQLTNKMYIKVNSIFPNVLSQICDKYQIKMIHPTTDCVYKGDKGSYTEKDEPDDDTIYGMTKNLGEPENCTVIRCSIIGEEVNNKRSLIEWIKSNRNGKIKGYTNHIWNGVTCLQYAKIVKHIIQHNLFWKGVRHISSPDVLNKHQIVSLINQYYSLNIEIEPFETSVICDRSLSSIYDLNMDIPNLEKQISELKEYNIISKLKSS